MRHLIVVGLFGSLCLSLTAQPSSKLNVRMYAGLTITGEVGTVYTIQSSTNLTASSDWRAVDIAQLPTNPYRWIDPAPAVGERFYRTVDGSTNLVWIPAGNFTMGSPDQEAERTSFEGPLTVVTITKAFFIGRFEVTQGEYVNLIGENPSYFRNGREAERSGTAGPVTNELRHPVEQVSYDDALVYCTKLTISEKQAGRLPDGWSYRLPTEAEWEYACRAGASSAFDHGSRLSSGMANFYAIFAYDSSIGTTPDSSGSYPGRSLEVGRYEPNASGLYDMYGNVAEWCSGRWSNRLQGGRVKDPQGPVSGESRPARGGHWGTGPSECRAAVRLFSNWETEDGRFLYGLRVVLAKTN